MNFSRPTTFSPRRAAVLLIGALAPMLTIIILAGSGSSARASVGHRVTKPAAKTAAPTASDFASYLVGAANQAAQQRGDDVRISTADCVEPLSGQYMCSYAVQNAGTTSCHLIQARWTPELESTITVTLSGQAKKCGTLREALHSLS